RLVPHPERRRRPPRAPDAGAARPADHPRAAPEDRRPHGRDRGRRAPQPRRALEPARAADARRDRPPGRPAHPRAARARRLRRRAAPQPGRRRARCRRRHDAPHPARAAGRELLPDPRRVLALLLPDRGRGPAREAARHHPPSGAAEPRPRDREHGRGRAVLGHYGPGDERGRGADGAPLPAGGAQQGRGRERGRGRARARAAAAADRGAGLAEIAEMHRAGIVGISDDGRPVIDAALMRRALEYSSMFGLPVIAHEEEPHLAAGGAMNEGVTALRLGLRGIPAAAEEVMIARDLALARLTGSRLHVAHVSTRGAVALLREAKAQALPVTAEVTPHHLFLTEEAVEGYGTNAKMAPPLRTRADVAALRAALADGTIDAIATDHAPHHHDEKEVEFDLAANGVVGLETALPLALRLVAEGVLDLPTLVARMTVGPARILRLPAGTLAPGAAADLTLVDPERRWRVEARAFRSKGRNTPFEGWDMTGRAVAVLVGGRLVHDERPATAPALRSAS